MSTEIHQVEISESIRRLYPGSECSSVMLLITLHGRPLCYVWLNGKQSVYTEDDLRYEVARQLPAHVKAQVSEMSLGTAGVLGSALLPRADKEPYRPSVSVVLCTCNRPDDLERCLDSLYKLDYPDLEVVVVNNSPGNLGTREAAARYPVVYVEEHRPGLSYARNAGIRCSRGDIIACTDDDCVVDGAWLDMLVKPFADPDVSCVTGLVVPAELKTRAQELFETYGGLGRGFFRRVYDSTYLHSRRLRAVPTWRMGATANAAFRRSALFEIGLFDVTLGVGTPTGCSEDTYAFYQLLMKGYKCIYEPWAFVWHRHRADLKGLRRQLLGYNKGHCAYHIKCLLAYGDLRAMFHMLVSMPHGYIWRVRQSIFKRSDYPVRLIMLEILGNLLGPLALVQSILKARRLERNSSGSKVTI